MTQKQKLKSLNTLLTLREIAVDKLSAEMARQAEKRERMRHNIERMQALCAGEAPKGRLALTQSLNFAHYKQTVLNMADAHRADLAMHEAAMAQTQRALTDASCKREVMGQVLAAEQQRIESVQRGQEQRRQDELGMQRWLRREA